MKIFGIAIFILGALVLSFGLSSLIVYGICWCLGFAFTWKLALGAWLLQWLFGSIFKLSK